MKKILMAISAIMVATAANAIEFEGFYKTIDDETKNAKSIVRLYECETKLCGRIVALYDVNGDKISETISNPVKIAEEVDGKPKMTGLDIIWNMEWDEDQYEDGKILDPKSGSVYSSVIWANEDPKLLNVRGKTDHLGAPRFGINWKNLNCQKIYRI
jgi:uncharacterized protein (DUF2147 family)